MLEFNSYSTPLLIGFLQGVVYALLLLRRSCREDRLSDRLLAILLLLGCLYIMQYMLGFGGWYDSHDGRSTFMFYFPFYLLVLIGPVMYFYFRSLANVRFRLQEKDAWHLLPGAAVLAIYLTVFLHDFINGYRIQAVQEKLQNGAAEQFTFMSIALECGFNSKATFNRAFRKQTGLSPREFLEKEITPHSSQMANG